MGGGGGTAHYFAVSLPQTITNFKLIFIFHPNDNNKLAHDHDLMYTFSVLEHLLRVESRTAQNQMSLHPPVQIFDLKSEISRVLSWNGTWNIMYMVLYQ